MKKLLHIIATPREEDSRTLKISDPFLEIFKKKHPDWVIDEINLAKIDLPEIGQKNVAGKYVLLEGKELFGKLKEVWAEIIQHIERFLSSDIILISTPMWNFSIPYSLKHYIDIIVQPQYLFRYVDTGVEGLAKNKKMIVLTSRGGQYDSTETENLDFQEPYLRAIFGFCGITDITFIKAEGMDTGRVQNLTKAIEQAKELANRV